MKRLTQTSFFDLIRSAEVVTSEMLEAAYGDFSERLFSVVSSPESFGSRYATLVYASAELSVIRKQLDPCAPETEAAAYYTDMAMCLTASHLDLLGMSLVNKDLFFSKAAAQKTPLVWSKAFTKHDLIELITALDELHAVENRTGGKAAFISLIKAFEELFGVELSRPYGQRDNVINRKIRTTHFLKRMQHALIERSQK